MQRCTTSASEALFAAPRDHSSSTQKDSEPMPARRRASAISMISTVSARKWVASAFRR